MESRPSLCAILQHLEIFLEIGPWYWLSYSKLCTQCGGCPPTRSNSGGGPRLDSSSIPEVAHVTAHSGPAHRNRHRALDLPTGGASRTRRALGAGPPRNETH